MIELPLEFKQNIISRYNKSGENWLNSIDAIIEKYSEKFDLHDIELLKDITMNIIIFANSNKYGEIVMKIYSPGQDMISEVNYISLCSSKYVAKFYYYNKEDRVIIMEKISPGYQIVDLQNREEKIKIFSNIVNNLINQNISKNKFKLYEDILKEKIQLVSMNKQKYNSILYMIDVINKIYNDLKELDLPKYVLHNDLNQKKYIKVRLRLESN